MVLIKPGAGSLSIFIAVTQEGLINDLRWVFCLNLSFFSLTNTFDLTLITFLMRISVFHSIRLSAPGQSVCHVKMMVK